MYHDVLFPTDFGYKTSGGPGFHTTIFEGDGGHDHTTQRWDTARRPYRVTYKGKTKAQAATMLDFFMTREGSAHSFRFKDFLDFTTASDHTSAHGTQDVQIGVGDGITKTFQLLTKYTSSAGDVYRNITKPVAAETLVSLDGTNQTSGWSVDDSTGIITFTTAPTAGQLVRAGCEFYVHVRFDENTDRHFEQSFDNFEQVTVLGDIHLIEVLPSDRVQPSQHLYGGASSVSMSADVQITAARGRVVNLSASTTSLTAYLEPVGKYAEGGPHFYLLNTGGNDITIDLSGSTVTLAAGASAVVLVKVVGSTKHWALLSL